MLKRRDGMALHNSIQQKQTQTLNISNQIVQSLNILNMGRYELEEAVEAESESNPVLEVEVKDDEINWEEYFKKEKFDYDFDKNEVLYTDSSDYDFENMTSDEDSLYDELHGQIKIMGIDETRMKVCDYLVDSLDEDGYLREKESDIADKLSVSLDLVEECIGLVQTLEPAGICARNLQECIILQLHSDGIYDDVLEDIIVNNINLVANSNTKQLASKYKKKQDEIRDYLELIKSLDPRPAERYFKNAIVYAYPDVVLEEDEMGNLVVRPYNEKRLKLNINSYYRDLYIKTDDPSVKSYIKEKLSSAKKIINDVEERKSTVIAIAEAIVEVQFNYFKYEGQLEPMSQQSIADMVGCHISTVSRGVNDKYILTKKGLFEIRSFFSGSLETDEGSTISISVVKNKLKDIIENENKKKPLSDKKLEDMLRAEGFDIARRTVAKYREEIGYLSSSKRKKI
ncbi:RNA polymerase factor sigma-54 [Peptostreptococcus sp. MV1]|uniref:RNA polymerase factor sigma-54 n=1 Tax=Peptostreptococcus sp. MV1 TaxID=1219626 RepID=UPI001FA6CC68|nr:RNA polymerase factor sigma-54 [Peptostreptococcus sp. MV1]